VRLRSVVIGLGAVAGIVGVVTAASWMNRDDDPRTVVVQMMDDGGKFRFEPENVEVRPGDIVEFVQAGSMPHNVEFVKNTAPAGVNLGQRWVGAFLTGKGEKYTVRIDGAFKPGTYDYLCTPHATLGMKGRITVKGARGSKAAQPAPPVVDEGDPSLPLIKGVHGGQEAKFTMVNGVKEFRMDVERIRWETKPGTVVEAWAFNRMIPGPTIRVNDGEKVRIIVTNKLPEGTTAHWHGLEVPNNMDGVPGISQDPIAPGESFTYEFTAKPYGTHLYHSHFNALHQEEHGLYGMFIVESEKESPELRADKEEMMILGDGPLGFVINGKEFPEVTPIQLKKGERVRVRMANLGGLYHPMHLHGGHFRVVSKDGFDLPASQQMNTLSIAPGETFDVVLQAEETGTWLWHCHVLSHVTGPKDETGVPTAAGMIGVVQIQDGKTQVAPISEHKNH